MVVYLVEKRVPSTLIENGKTVNITISFMEAVFDSEQKAVGYIATRKEVCDRDDKGCSFEIIPWNVE